MSGTPGYLGISEIRDDATVADLNPLTFEPEDLQALKKCREGACDVQLPTTSIQAFRDSMDFSRPDAAEQANALARPMVLQLLRAYQQGGHRALGEYRDKKDPARIADQFETMVGRAEGHDFGAVAIKQLYATHYFHTALDLTVWVDDDGAGGSPAGFYLLTLKGSQQEGLTGVKAQCYERSSSTRRAARWRARSHRSSARSKARDSLDQPR